MSSPDLSIYEFGEFRIEAARRRLLRNGTRVPLTPKAFDTLLHLVQRNGEILEKEELMRAIWPDTVVEENNLNQNISALRRVLSERRGQPEYILTVPGRGYRFVGKVETVKLAAEEPSCATLAVLPVENLSAEPEREYLADGLTEELIAALGQIEPEHISVIGRTSVMAYKRASRTAAQIGRELNAAYLIESSLRAEGGRLRITSKLIRTRDQVQVWSASYDSEPSSMLAFQRELSAVLAEQIRLRLSPERLTALERRQTQNPQAYDLYLRGRHLWNQLTSATTRSATEYYTRATRLDPEYALAWCGLADAFSSSPITVDARPLEMLPRARDAASRAFAAQPELAEVQTSIAFFKFWLEWDWPGAEAAYRKAIAIDPHYSLAYRLLGILLSHLARSEEAAFAMQRARELDQLLAVNHALSSQVAFAGRNYDAAVRFARQAITMDPEFWIGHMQLGQAYVELGNSELALQALDKAVRTSGGNSKPISLRAYLWAKLGQAEQALETLKTLEAISPERYVPPYGMALICAALGRQDQAVQWLDRAFDCRDVHLTFLTIDPKWDRFRSDARFAALLRRCGFAG